jgi:hypothetical protein
MENIVTRPGHLELAVLDSGGQLISELSPDSIGPDLHFYGQFSVKRNNGYLGGPLF